MSELDQILDDDKVPYSDLKALFARAKVNVQERLHRVDLCIANKSVRIEIVGNGLAAGITRAFSHLIGDVAGKPDLAIHMWDEQETGILAGRSAYQLSDNPVDMIMKTSRNGRYIGDERRHGASWLDCKGDTIVSYTASTRALHLDERARPFHKLLSYWLSEHGVQFIHAGLIAHNGKGILFVGNGGAGKSTSSIACLQDGFQFLGDDFVGFQCNDDQNFTGYGFFASCLLNIDHLNRFPELKPHASSANYAREEKSVIFLQDKFQDCLSSKITIRALALPRVVNAETSSFRPASRAQALFAIAPTSVMHLPRPNRKALDRLAELAEAVPAFWLELGRDIQSIPRCLEQLIAELPE